MNVDFQSLNTESLAQAIDLEQSIEPLSSTLFSAGVPKLPPLRYPKNVVIRAVGALLELATCYGLFSLH